MNVHPCFAISFNGAGAANVDRNSRRASESDHRLSYCPGEFHFGDLRLPRKNRPHPVAVVIHGGFWRSIYGLDYMWPACAALTKNGVATWNIETAESIMANLSAAVPNEFPDRYNFASPIELLPLGLPQKLFHGTADTSVPHAMRVVYVRAAQPRGDEAELITLENAGPFEVVDPRTKEFDLVRQTALSPVIPATP